MDPDLYMGWYGMGHVKLGGQNTLRRRIYHPNLSSIKLIKV